MNNFWPIKEKNLTARKIKNFGYKALNGVGQKMFYAAILTGYLTIVVSKNTQLSSYFYIYQPVINFFEFGVKIAKSTRCAKDNACALS